MYLPASVPKCAVSFLKELANHGCRFAVSQVMGIATVVSFFAKTMHEISEKRYKNKHFYTDLTFLDS